MSVYAATPFLYFATLAPRLQKKSIEDNPRSHHSVHTSILFWQPSTNVIFLRAEWRMSVDECRFWETSAHVHQLPRAVGGLVIGPWSSSLLPLSLQCQQPNPEPKYPRVSEGGTWKQLIQGQNWWAGRKEEWTEQRRQRGDHSGSISGGRVVGDGVQPHLDNKTPFNVYSQLMCLWCLCTRSSAKSS